jgi:methionyl-tRNA formyltransferase
VTRLVFLGSPEAAVPSLRALVDAGHEVALVVSQPDRRRGRGGALVSSPVKQAALALGVSVTDRLDDVLDAGADLGVVVAYGRIVPRRVLDRLPMVNVHFSLLPRWRGAAPVERALLAGDAETGVCIMRLEEGLDTGPVLARAAVPIDHVGGEGAAALTARLSALGASLLVDCLAPGAHSLGPGEAQTGEPTYAAKLEPGEFHLDWLASAEALARTVRLDRAWTTFRGQRLRVLRARVARATDTGADADGTGAAGSPPGTLAGEQVACGDGALVLEEVQPEGRKPMAAGDWGRGVRPAPGERLGE